MLPLALDCSTSDTTLIRASPDLHIWLTSPSLLQPSSTILLGYRSIFFIGYISLFYLLP